MPATRTTGGPSPGTMSARGIAICSRLTASSTTPSRGRSTRVDQVIGFQAVDQRRLEFRGRQVGGIHRTVPVHIELFITISIQNGVAQGVDVVTVRDLGLLGRDDMNHLQNATGQNRVFCTYDSDLIQIAASGMNHAGIVFGQQDIHYIGDWVNWASCLKL